MVRGREEQGGRMRATYLFGDESDLFGDQRADRLDPSWKDEARRVERDGERGKQ